MEEQMRKWIQDNLAAGYTVDQLRESLSKGNYDPHLIDEYLGFNKPRQSNSVTQKDKTNIFAFAFTFVSIMILLASPFLPWVNYGKIDAKGTLIDSKNITGFSTPFGKAVMFVGGASLILSILSVSLNRKFSIGTIALSLFAVGVVVISIMTINGTAGSQAAFSAFRTSTGSTIVQNAYGHILAALAACMVFCGGSLSMRKNKSGSSVGVSYS